MPSKAHAPAQLLCKIACSACKSTRSCTIIMQNCLLCPRKHTSLHNYCAKLPVLPSKAHAPAQLLCIIACFAFESTRPCTIIVHNCLFCLQKHTLLHNYCAKQAQSGLQGSVCPMLPALRKCPRLPRLLLRLRLLQSLRVLLLHYPVCPGFLHLLLWRKILCGCLLRPA